jgi:hypothetical protein
MQHSKERRFAGDYVREVVREGAMSSSSIVPLRGSLQGELGVMCAGSG